jgi:hypothetical protein
MARYRVTEARTIEGYELKAAYIYASGDIVEDGVTPADHVARLGAAGVLEELPVEIRAAQKNASARDRDEGPPSARAGEPSTRNRAGKQDV